VSLGELLPPVNACLNGLSALLLIGGFVAIRSGRRQLHRVLMTSAFISSTLFLISYITRFALTGTTPFVGPESVRAVYLTVLASHSILAAVLLPLVFRTLWLAAVRGRFDAHKRIARWTFPIWVYVSVSGVAVYFLLYHWPR
jgi:putative membrane protein